MILTVVFLDREIVDACNSKAGEPVLIVLPVLISVGTEPVAAVVMTLIGEASCTGRSAGLSPLRIRST